MCVLKVEPETGTYVYVPKHADGQLQLGINKYYATLSYESC